MSKFLYYCLMSVQSIYFPLQFNRLSSLFDFLLGGTILLLTLTRLSLDRDYLASLVFLGTSDSPQKRSCLDTFSNTSNGASSSGFLPTYFEDYYWTPATQGLATVSIDRHFEPCTNEFRILSRKYWLSFPLQLALG